MLPSPPHPHDQASKLQLLTLILGIGLLVLGGTLTAFVLSEPGRRPASCTTEALQVSSSTPLVTFSSVVLIDGTASFSIAEAKVCPTPNAYRFNLGFESKGGPASEFPSSGQFVRTVVSNTTFRVSWLDRDGQGLVNVGDTFTVSGDDQSLPSGASFTFYLYWLDLNLINAANWRT